MKNANDIILYQERAKSYTQSYDTEKKRSSMILTFEDGRVETWVYYLENDSWEKV